MATVQDLLDDLNQRLGDANNAAGVGQTTKIRWIQHGIRAMWPSVFRVVTDQTLAIVDGTYEYTLPAGMDEAEVYRIEVQRGSTDQLWARVDGWLIDRHASKRLIFTELPGRAGADLRIHAVAPCANDALTTASVLDFSTRFNELPVLYAMGLALQNQPSNSLETRADYTRYSTVVGRNGVGMGDLMSAAQFHFAQFELLLERMAMPWPAG